MQVVLRNDLEKVGKKGDIVDVADGYARNFLIPRGRAFAATEGVSKQAEAMRTSRDRADAKEREAAQIVAAQLTGATIRIEARVGAEGKLFGSVTTHEIVEAVQAQLAVTIDRRQIDQHEPVKTSGQHTIVVKLHPEVRSEVTLEVADAKE